MRRSLYGIVFLTACVVIAYLYFSHNDNAELQVGQLSGLPGKGDDYPAGAIPYALPQKTFVVSTSTRITGCDALTAGGMNTEIISGVTSLKISIVTEVDPDSRYYIYVNSGQKSKNLEYEVQYYPNGTLKALSVAITDQVVPIAASITGGLLQVYHVVGGGTGGAFLPPPAHPFCSKLNAAIQENPKNPHLTISQQFRWTPDLDEVGYGEVSEQFEADLSKLAQQFDLRAPVWAVPNASIELDLPEIVNSSPDIFFAPGVCRKSLDPARGYLACGPDLADGLILRNPILVRMHPAVCDSTCAQIPWSIDDENSNAQLANLTELPDAPVVMPQLGKKFLIPVHSGFAQNAALDLALDPDGMITGIGLLNTSAVTSDIDTLRKDISGANLSP
jgi:hypothetical protein